MTDLGAAAVPNEWLTIEGFQHRRVVLCFIFRSSGGSREVLLGLKRTGFGAGRVVAIGGKIDGLESDAEAAVREVREESGIEFTPAELRYVGRISWYFPAMPGWSMAATLFVADGGGAVPIDCDEIEPRWYEIRSIPWDQMWKDAAHWLPSVLDGREIDGRIVLAEDNETVASAVLR